MSSIIRQGWMFNLAGPYTLTNLTTTDQLVAQSDTVPRGYRGILKDTGIIFTTLGGSVYFAHRYVSGGFLRITDNLTASATGIANYVLDEGERLEVRIGSSGSGIIQVYGHGEIEEKLPTLNVHLFPKEDTANLYQIGGF